MKNKVALEDEHRINNIITSLNCYTQTILEEYLNSYKKEDTITDATKELIKQFHNEQNILDTIEKSVNILVNTIKEIYKKKTYLHLLLERISLYKNYSSIQQEFAIQIYNN